MKRGYSRFRIMLMAFALGLTAVYMWQGLSFAWWGVPVDLPEARSAGVLEVTVPIEEKPRGPKYLCDEFTDENERARVYIRLSSRTATCRFMTAAAAIIAVSNAWILTEPAA